MSKVFKIVVNIIIAICIIAVAALLVPPLVGVKTEVAGPQMDKNISEGTVAYGVRRPLATLTKGDEIIYSGDGYLYLYNVESTDPDNGEITVTDKTSSDPLVLPIQKNATKKVLTVPFLGYILLAINSSNGLAILISAAAVLAALFIIAALWDNRRKTENTTRTNADEDDEYFSILAQSIDQPSKLDEVLTRPASESAKTGPYEAIADSPTIQMPAVEKSSTAAAAAAGTGAASAIGTGSFSVYNTGTASEDMKSFSAADTSYKAGYKENKGNERNEGLGIAGIAAAGAAAAGIAAAVSSKKSEESDSASAPVSSDSEVKTAAGAQAAENPSEQRLPKENFNTDSLSAAFARIMDDKSPASLDVNENEIPGISVALVAALETTQVSRQERPAYQPPVEPAAPAEPEVEPDEVELAIPVRTANEILDDAYAKGYDPHVITDDVTGIKLIDFSDCF